MLWFFHAVVFKTVLILHADVPKIALLADATSGRRETPLATAIDGAAPGCGKCVPSLPKLDSRSPDSSKGNMPNSQRSNSNRSIHGALTPRERKTPRTVGSTSSRTVLSSARSTCSGAGTARRVESLQPPAPHALPEMLHASLASVANRPPPIPMEQLVHSVATLSRTGKTSHSGRKTNQDSCFAYTKFLEPHQGLMGVMDGHGPQGHKVSAHLKRYLPLTLAEHISRYGSDRGGASTAAALVSSFLECHAKLSESPIDMDDALIDCSYSGSTAVLTYLEGRRIVAAWVGDSRAIVVRADPRGPRAVNLTRDHKPHIPSEKDRIMACGGRVERLIDGLGRPVGPFRVWLHDAWVPGLAMSRALGDVLAHQVGVSSEPETTVADITPQDKFLVLASDGVWEFIDGYEAAELIITCSTAEEACRVLVESAYLRWNEVEKNVSDDITVVVVKFNPM